MMLTVCVIFHPINGSIITCKKGNNLKKVEQLRNFLKQHDPSQIKFLCTLIIQPRDPCYNMPSNSLVFGKRGINNSVIVPLDEIAEIKDPYRATRGLGVSFLSRFNVKITMKYVSLFVVQNDNIATNVTTWGTVMLTICDNDLPSS